MSMLPIFDLSTADGRAGLDERLVQLRQTASASSDAATATAAIVADVRERGDEAVVEYMQRWTDPGFTVDRIRVAPEQIRQAEREVPAELLQAIDRSIAHVQAYQQHIRPRDTEPVNIGGARLSMRYTPVDSAALAVPGGTAVLFSTLIMLAVPAMVAGVPASQLSVLHPPPTRRGDDAPAEDISPIVLATCQRLGIEKVYRIGGAQGVAAAAFGTERVEPVDLIAGPGNVFVQLAKAQVSGVCGTDNGFYGPSEIVTIADETARPACIAADLIAQAEHDPGKCFFVTWSQEVVDNVLAEIDRQLPDRRRREAIEKAFANESCIVLTPDHATAIDVANQFAAEHVNLAVADAQAMLGELRHGGEVFLGDATPVASGDYYAGPSHCLPTGTTARFTSGISCHTFLKRTGVVAYPDGMPEQAICDIAAMAEAEGLDGHAQSARVRGQ